MLEMKRGQKDSISKLCGGLSLTVELFHKSPMEIDCSCFGLDVAGKLADDQYFIFYNHKESPEQAVCLLPPALDGAVRFAVQLDKLPAKIDRLSFTCAIDGVNCMRELTQGFVRLKAGETECARYRYSGAEFAGERALVICELYRKNGDWRINAVGRGFNGGLKALIESYGGIVTREARSPTPAAPVAAPSGDVTVTSLIPPDVVKRMNELTERAKRENDYLLPLYRSLYAGINLLPQSVSQPVRVVMAADNSGSMFDMYRNGRVQRIIDKFFAFASVLHPSCSMDFWAFAAKSRQFEPVTMDNVRTYSFDTGGGFERWMSMLNYQYNNEPEAMRDIMMIYGGRNAPTVVLFLTDGRLSSDWEIEEILIKTSRYPIFWQFVGVHGEEYGILEHLEEIDGRHCNNASFFRVNDIDDITDSALYSRLLVAMCNWMEEASRKRLWEQQTS